ncbi:MAG: LCP family protein [Candidatus Levybacteria bacterium]|nr:LCP family protein [Candidatus Levybacteria bacterium]
MRKKRIFIIVAIVFLVVFGRLFFEGLKLSPVFFQFLFSREIELKKTDERMGVLILGVGGERHEGPLLTDTIIYASIDPAKKKIALLSLPRDFWVPDLKAKINTAYAYGEGKRKGGGIILSKAVVEKVLAQPVDYVVRVDFKGFVKAIDMLGGIEVDVEREFDDYEYPVAGKETDACGFEGEEFEKRATASAALEAFPCRYMHLRFEKGRQPMDGETALRFVRSRHAIGVEGTDFARSKRQEKVIEAVKTKLFSLGTFLNPFKLTSLYDTLPPKIRKNQRF